MTAQPVCMVCGEPSVGFRAKCVFCGDDPRRQNIAAPALPLKEAVNRWSRRKVGGPRTLSNLVTSVQVKDEVIERLLTVYRKRSFSEHRGPSNSHTPSRPQIAFERLDPFAFDARQLREATIHRVACLGCQGSGKEVCSRCKGSGRASCPNCSGSGKEVRHYKKSSRLVNCTVCKGKGTNVCGVCGKSGRVPCGLCQSSGTQLLWLEFTESEETILKVSDSPLVRAFPKLAGTKTLKQDDVPELPILINRECEGALKGTDSGEKSWLDQHAAHLDPRCDRIVSQQFLRLTALRRDVTFQMCGTNGTAVFSGAHLVHVPTVEANRPIKRRLWIWFFALVSGLFVSSVIQTALLPQGEYFDRSRGSVGLWFLVALGSYLWAVAGILREWRPGWKFGRITLGERGAIGVLIASLLAGVFIGFKAQPTTEKVVAALSSGDLTEAALLVSALETSGRAKDALPALRDDVWMAAAAVSKGNDSLRYLDNVAAGGRRRSEEAARLVLETRVALVRTALASSDLPAARRDLNRWFHTSKEPVVAELQAKLEDLTGERCDNDVCRLTAAVRSQAAQGSPTRTERVENLRQTLVSALTFTDTSNELLLHKLVRHRQAAALASSLLAIPEADNELKSQATRAVNAADAARNAVPLLGQTKNVVMELIGELKPHAVGISFATIHESALFFAFDGNEIARGAYAARLKPGKAWDLARLVLGHQVTPRLPSGSAESTSRTVTQWWDTGVPVVARWRNDEAVEIRIGAATP